VEDLHWADRCTAAAILGDEPEPALVEGLFERSEGNPFFAEELLAASESVAGSLPATRRKLDPVLRVGVAQRAAGRAQRRDGIADDPGCVFEELRLLLQQVRNLPQ
jgi:hypothetical protein